MNHFRGRSSCPYGQNAPDLDLGEDGIALGVTHAEHCSIPGDVNSLVGVPVRPQLLARQPLDAVYCSCRCDGPDSNTDYCQCGEGFVCQELVGDVGLGLSATIAGSYCVKEGTEVQDSTLISQMPCSWLEQSCGSSISVTPVEVISAPPGQASTSFTDWLRVDPQGALLCMPIQLPVDDAGNVACTLIEVQPNPVGACDCSAEQARAEVSPSSRTWIEAKMSERRLCEGAACQTACACTITRLEGEARTDCENNQASTADGWCYVAADQQIGNPDLVAGCPTGAPRTVRLLGKGLPREGASVMFSCGG